MGQLVGDDVGDQLQLAHRGRRRVDQQDALPERDAAQVLHGAGCEVGQGQEVDLVARVRDPVVVLEPAQRERADVQPEVGEVGLAGDVDHTQRDAVDVDRVRRHERADDERHEVCAHHHRVGEPHRDLRPVRTGPFRALDLGAVRDGHLIGVDDEGDAEHGLEVGFVPAGEGPPAVGRLHLARGDDALEAVLVAIRAAIEAAQLVVEDAGEGDDDLDRARFQPADRPDDQPLGLGGQRP